MREIKFGAFHCESKTMYSWDDLINRIGLSESVFVETEQWKPMQYTGLKDKNGNEIYERDIMKTHTGWKTVVQWDEKQLMYRGFMVIWEIIGNIHQNPKLLEKLK